MSEIEKLKHDIARYIKITSEQADEIERLKEGHCKDCCCARSWEALGNPPYSGTSIPEHIAQLRRELAEARGMRAKAEFWAKHSPWKPACGPVSRDGVMQPCADPRHDWTDEQWQAEAAKKD